MKKFKVVLLLRHFETFLVEAENEEKAIEKAIQGDCERPLIEPDDFEIDSVKEID